MNMLKNLMGNGGPVCKLIGSGDCNNCKAKEFKKKIPGVMNPRILNWYLSMLE